jgi:hypothetical protein
MTVLTGRIQEWMTPDPWMDFRYYVVAAGERVDVYEIVAGEVAGRLIYDRQVVHLERYERQVDRVGFYYEWTTRIDLVRLPEGWQVQSFRQRYQDRESGEEWVRNFHPDCVESIEPISLPESYSLFPKGTRPANETNSDDQEEPSKKVNHESTQIE